MAYKIEKCDCGNNDWDLIAQRFQCNCCDCKKVVNKFEEGVDNPLASVYLRREKKDGSAEEEKALNQEKDKVREKMLRKPPNCS